MRKKGKSGEGGAEKGEFLGEKLKRRSAGGPPSKPCSTPVLSWVAAAQDSTFPLRPVSARRLAASVWDFSHFLPVAKMHRGGASGNPPPPPPPPLRRHRRHRREGGTDHPTVLADAYPSSPDQPTTASSLTRHIATSLMRHHQSIGRNFRALQPASPTSYASSLEVAPYNPVVTPSSSVDCKGRVVESGYSLKTSAELLKVLNRIWCLEEQHTSNIATVKALKVELDHARARIKELLRDQQADRQEIDELMKQIAEDKLIRKSKEIDRINAAVKSARDELEDERKLRRRSESLHRKLARELSDLKSALSDALKKLEREKKSRMLLEDLCDEFAGAIKDYEQEIHALKQKSDKDWAGKADRERLILHISESWLDERFQMRLAHDQQHGFTENNSIVDKLRFEIEAFLQAQRTNTPLPSYHLKPRSLRRSSLESIPLNEAVSAPQGAADEEDSEDSDVHCFELHKPTNEEFKQLRGAVGHIDGMVKPNPSKKFVCREKSKGQYNSSTMQVKFEQQMARAMNCNQNKTTESGSQQADEGEGNSADMFISKRFQNCEATGEGSHDRKNSHDETKLSHVVNNLIRGEILLSEGQNMHPEDDSGKASRIKSSWMNHVGHASPVRPWMSDLIPQDLDISESSSKLPPAIKENTLKAKLVEARSKVVRSRLKPFKGST